MKAEIIGIGTELLLGQIPNTNAQRVSQTLASVGVDVLWHTVVGDNLGRIAAAIQQALARSDAVVITGGLGPTPDDITREGVAAATGRRLLRDEHLAEIIRGIFERLGRHMPAENLRQAELPEGAVAIAPEGTAPGFYLEHSDRLVFALPGVPWEMEAMLGKTVAPLLRDKAGAGAIVSREILVVGLGESHTNEKINDIVATQSNPTIAYLAGGGQVRVRITAKAQSEDAALALVAPVEDVIRDRLGDSAVEGHHSSVADALGAMLRTRGATVAAGESLTGGLIGAELTKVAGSSDFFLGSLVTYATDSKRAVAEVDAAILTGPGPVSKEAAAALAQGAAKKFGGDLGISATGVAGPAEQDGEPVGTIFVGATWAGRTEVRYVRGYGDRDNIRALATTYALDLGRRMLKSTP